MTGSKKKTNPLPKTSMLQGLLAAAAAIDPGTVEMPQFSDKCQHWKPVITEPSDYLRGLIAHRFQLLDEYEAMVAAAKHESHLDRFVLNQRKAGDPGREAMKASMLAKEKSLADTLELKLGAVDLINQIIKCEACQLHPELVNRPLEFDGFTIGYVDHDNLANEDMLDSVTVRVPGGQSMSVSDYLEKFPESMREGMKESMRAQVLHAQKELGNRRDSSGIEDLIDAILGGDPLRPRSLDFLADVFDGLGNSDDLFELLGGGRRRFRRSGGL